MRTIKISAIQICYNQDEMPEAIRHCMDSVKKAYPDYTLITDNPYSSAYLRASADYHRLLLAADNNDMVWVDNDCFIKKPLEMSGDLPYFAMQGRRPDIYYFAVNGRSDLFRQALDECYEGMPETYRDMIEFNKRISRFFKDKFAPIDKKTYYHLMAHKWAKRVYMNRLRMGHCIK